MSESTLDIIDEVCVDLTKESTTTIRGAMLVT
jgi:hypothetical protein